MKCCYAILSYLYEYSFNENMFAVGSIDNCNCFCVDTIGNNVFRNEMPNHKTFDAVISLCVEICRYTLNAKLRRTKRRLTAERSRTANSAMRLYNVMRIFIQQ